MRRPVLSGLRCTLSHGAGVQRENVVAIHTEASDSGRAHALYHVFDVLNASEHSQPPQHLVSVHPAPFHAPDLLISGASFATRAQRHPASIPSILISWIGAILAVVASPPTAKLRPAVAPSPLGGNAVQCAG